MRGPRSYRRRYTVIIIIYNTIYVARGIQRGVLLLLNRPPPPPVTHVVQRLAFYRISLFQRRGALLNTTPAERRSSFASVSITHRRLSSCRRLVLRACFAWQLPEPRLHIPRGHVLAHVFGAQWTDVK